jgi:hypothetical protein
LGENVALPRVYDIAKELKIDSKVAVALLIEMGAKVKSGASTITPVLAEKLRQHFNSEYAPKKGLPTRDEVLPTRFLRVSDVAQDLGIDSKLALTVLAQSGHFVESANSIMALELEKSLRDYFETAGEGGRSELTSIEELAPKPFLDSAPKEKEAYSQIVVPRTSIKHMTVEDHPAFLAGARETATQRLLIVSPWVKNGVITDLFIDSLVRASKRGVKVTLALGMNGTLEDSDKRAVHLLRNLSKSKDLSIDVSVWKSHEKILIVDDVYAVSSFNWLSFGGSTKEYYRRERGLSLRDADMADLMYQELIEAINREGSQL